MRPSARLLARLAVLAPLAAIACTPGDAPAARGTSGALPPAAAACSPWGGRGFAVTARHQAGHGAQFRELTYDDATGKLSVHDSDLYASGSGKESPTPRVIQRSITLAQAERDKVAADLSALCPDAKALAARCAPGGCSSADVSASGSKTRIEDHVMVGKVVDRLAPFFPELRR